MAHEGTPDYWREHIGRAQFTIAQLETQLADSAYAIEWDEIRAARARWAHSLAAWEQALERSLTHEESI